MVSFAVSIFMITNNIFIIFQRTRYKSRNRIILVGKAADPATDPNVPAMDPTVPGSDPGVPTTDPGATMTDPGVPDVDPTQTPAIPETPQTSETVPAA